MWSCSEELGFETMIVCVYVIFPSSDAWHARARSKEHMIRTSLRYLWLCALRAFGIDCYVITASFTFGGIACLLPWL